MLIRRLVPEIHTSFVISPSNVELPLGVVAVLLLSDVSSFILMCVCMHVCMGMYVSM